LRVRLLQLLLCYGQQLTKLPSKCQGPLDFKFDGASASAGFNLALLISRGFKSAFDRLFAISAV